MINIGSKNRTWSVCYCPKLNGLFGRRVSLCRVSN